MNFILIKNILIK